MTLKVKPEDLRAAAQAVNTAVQALQFADVAGASAQGSAQELHYEPAAGRAEAVAQKATENLKLARDALNGLHTGLIAAADQYTTGEHKLSARMGGKGATVSG